MKRLLIGVTAIALLASPAANAQPDGNRGQRGESGQHEGRRHDNGRNQSHDGQWHENGGRQGSGHRDNGRHRGWGRERGQNYHWGRGQYIGYNDWRNARRVDYRRHHLRQPARGYEWRRNNDRYVLVAVATGLIISVILSNGR